MVSRQPAPKTGHERVLVLVKALPHPGRNHGETVCCAGVTADGAWRRQYPIHFRQLQDRFSRWQWIEYAYVLPKDDRRHESRRVQEDTLQVFEKMPERERAGFLTPIIDQSTTAAAEKGKTLTLIRPVNPRFYWVAKPDDQIAAEKRANEAAARQLSIFDNEIAALNPCKYEFRFDYATDDGNHTGKCVDWETSATFYRWERQYGERRALDRMSHFSAKITLTREWCLRWVRIHFTQTYGFLLVSSGSTPLINWPSVSDRIGAKRGVRPSGLKAGPRSRDKSARTFEVASATGV
jgi:hypothetical protein